MCRNITFDVIACVTSSLGQSPDLVDVTGRAAPDLHDVAVAAAAVGKVEALACVRMGELVVNVSSLAACLPWFLREMRLSSV